MPRRLTHVDDTLGNAHNMKSRANMTSKETEKQEDDANQENSTEQQDKGDVGMAEHDHEHHPVVIVGGGIGGLVLALCLDQVYNHPEKNDNEDSASSSSSAVVKQRPHLPIHVYESTADYTANAGGAIGLYSNGLRVLRHLSNTHPKIPTVLSDVRTAGCDYIYRRWMRHDGLEVAVAREDELLPDVEVEMKGEEGDGDEGVVCEETSLGRATSGNTASTADSSSSQQQQQQRRARGDSISSQDKEGERADCRPRGGSFGNLKDTFQKLGVVDSAKETIAETSIPGEEQKPGEEYSPPAKRPVRSSFAAMKDAFQNLVVPNKEDKERSSVISTVSSGSTRNVETDLLSIGIRRWKYQQVLYESCVAAGIHMHFGKRLQHVTSLPPDKEDGKKEEGAKTLLQFKDGSKVTTSLLIGADGINSKVRNYVTNPTNDATEQSKQEEYVPEYTGVTCLMGCANVPRIRGICFPSSQTTKCHACYYPTRAPREGTDDDPSDYEQVFQIYFPSPIERPDTWRTLTPQEAKEECKELAAKLREDGWDEQFLKPLESETLTGVLRVGLRSREGLDCWHVGGGENEASGKCEESKDGEDNTSKKNAGLGRVVLLGDAAHPPVPYIGQGAMMAMEDAGTLSMILGHFCPFDTKQQQNSTTAQPDFTQFSKAMSVYESLRVTRTKAILGSSVALGKTQQKRAESKLYNAWREMSLKAQVWAYGTLPVMRPGAAFDYRVVVEDALTG